jgi:hypothetical protein
MQFNTKHIKRIKLIEPEPPTVFIENQSQFDASGKHPLPLEGTYWTATAGIAAPTDPKWAMTRGEPSVRIPMFRYCVSANMGVIAAAMFEMGIVARDKLNLVQGLPDKEPDWCHVFFSDVFLDDEKAYVYFGISFQYLERKPDDQS